MKKFILFILVSVAVSADAQTAKTTNMNELLTQCMQIKGDVTNRQMALWMPYHLWQEMGDQMKMSPSILADLVNDMTEYHLFLVVDYTRNGTTLNMKTKEDMIKTMQLTDAAGNILKPVDDADLPPQMRMILESLTPTLSRMMGELGDGMRIILFKAKLKNGEPGINAGMKNDIHLTWDNYDVEWKLPLPALMPAKFCPVDHEKMQGDWLYCPIHGVKLG